MLDVVLGNKSASTVLRYLIIHGEGYAMGIARQVGTALSPIQNQLERLERGGVVQSRYVGRTRLYSFASQRLLSIFRELDGQSQAPQGHVAAKVYQSASDLNWDED